MSFSERFIRIFRSVLPAPFTIAVLLTLITFVLAYFFAGSTADSELTLPALMKHWEAGLWKTKLLEFAVQMMLMLVLGHVLALTRPVNKLIGLAVTQCNNTAKAAGLVTLLTVLVSLFNWGLGLIFGAIFARKVGEHARAQGIPLNYPLIGAAGYSGLMVWHGGVSGSSLIKIAEQGHIRDLMQSQFSEVQLAALPEAVGFSETVFSPLNLTVSLLLVVLLPLAMYLLGKRATSGRVELRKNTQQSVEEVKPFGAEKLDHARWLGFLFGGIVLLYSAYKAFGPGQGSFLSYFTPNNINLLLLGLGILLHGNFYRFLGAVEQAISGASGILIQFPLYFGIMGVMVGSGMVSQFSWFIAEHATETSYPIFTFLSAGLVNIFVPSGGGQWAVQGPIIIEAAQTLNIPLAKSVLAMAYGDQITNMLQPFWALPLLGITGLKAKEILPYTLYLMLVGAMIFITALLIF